MDRHGRQARLAEVGVAGQERIARACVSVALDGLAADAAVRYLAGAGVATLCVRDPELAATARAIDPTLHVSINPGLPRARPEIDLPIHDPTAAALAHGAWFAMSALRAALDGAP